MAGWVDCCLSCLLLGFMWFILVVGVVLLVDCGLVLVCGLW